MKARIAYESAWGNAHAIAEAIGERLSEHGIDLRVTAVQDAHETHRVA